MDWEMTILFMDKWMKLLFGKMKMFFFILTELETISFHNDFMAYEVEKTDNRAVVVRHDISWHGMLHIVQKNSKKFIVKKDTSCIENTLQSRSFFYFTTAIAYMHIGLYYAYHKSPRLRCHILNCVHD